MPSSVPSIDFSSAAQNLLEWVTTAQLQSSAGFSGYYRRMAGSVRARRRTRVRRGTGRGQGIAACVDLGGCLAFGAGRRLLGEPRAGLRSRSGGRGRCSRPAADRAANLAVLRDLRHSRRQHVASRQFSGGSGARSRLIGHRRPTSDSTCCRSPAPASSAGWVFMTPPSGSSRRLHRCRRLERYRGHFYNWYDTRDLRALEPNYVSTVDSGNLAGHLITLANSCRAGTRNRLSRRRR